MIKKEIRDLCDELAIRLIGVQSSFLPPEQIDSLALSFLSVQYALSLEISRVELEARKHKSGLKSIKGAVYLAEASKGDKKPTEAALEAKVNTSELVLSEQSALDEAEVDRDLLQNYLSVFREAHVYFRGISKNPANV